LSDVPTDRLTLADLARRADFALGAVQVSPSTRVLRGPDGEASLEPLAMQVLVVLADAAGTVVTRDEIFRRCWGNAVVGDDSLNRTIADIRRAGRAAGAEAFGIETVPRTGYRLTVGSADHEDASDRRQVRLDRRLVLAAAVPAVAAVGAGAWLLRPKGAPSQVEALISESDQAMRLGMPEGSGRAV